MSYGMMVLLGVVFVGFSIGMTLGLNAIHPDLGWLAIPAGAIFGVYLGGRL